MSEERKGGNYHVIQGGTWKVAKWEPSRFTAPISGHWYIAGYKRSFLDAELDSVGPRIFAPDLPFDPIAEAVAAERERILAEWEKCESVLDDFLGDAEHFELADDSAVDISDASKVMDDFAKSIRDGDGT